MPIGRTLPARGARAAPVGFIPSVPQFDPATLFAGGGIKGWWRDPSDLSTQWQDSAKTIPVALDQPVGYVLDKSGNGNHWQQPTAAARPILRLVGGSYCWETDGVDDGYNGLGASAHTTSMDVFYAVQPAAGETSWVAVPSSGNGAYLGVVNAGDSQAAQQNCGTPSYFVDRATVAAVRSSLASALPPTVTHLLEARNADLSAMSSSASWVEDRWANYPGLLFAGRLYGTIGVPLATGNSSRVNIENYLAAKAGITLP